MAGALALGAVLEPIERRISDARMEIRPDAGWPADLVVVKIDDAATQAFGPVPWAPERMRSLLEAIERGGAKTLALDAMLPRPTDPEAAERLAQALDRAVLAVPWIDTRGTLRAEDAALLDPSLVTTDAGGPRFAAAGFLVPPVGYANAALGLGHSIAETDRDGVVRRTRPLVAVAGTRSALPSAPLAAWLHHHDLDPSRVVATVAGVTLPDRTWIPSPLELDLVAAPPRSLSAAALLAGEPPDLAGALAIVCVDTAAAPDRARTRLGETPGCDLFAAAVRTVEKRSWPRRVPAVPAVLFLAALSLVLTRRSHLTALAGTWLVAGLALVPLADVHLPLVAPLAFAAIDFALRGGTEAARASPAGADRRSEG